MSNDITKIPNQKEYKDLTPFDLVLIQKFPFIEEDFDAVNIYGIISKIKDYLNTTIANEQIVTENQQSVFKAFTDLHNYVEDYFDNLDVQDEINNKLDEMAEDGTLENILLNYVNITKIYDTTIEMISDYSNLVANQKVKTLGYHNINDNGGAYFLIRNKTLSDVNNDGTIIILTNNLVAEMIFNSSLNVEHFGAYGDNQHDDTQAIQKCFNNATQGITINFGNDKSYIVKSKITIPKYIFVDGHNAHIRVLSNDNNFSNNDYIFEYGENNAISKDNITSIARSSGIKNIQLQMQGNSNININGIQVFADCVISNILASGLNISIKVKNTYIDKVKIDGVETWNKYGTDYAIDTGYMGDAREITNCHMYNPVVSPSNHLKIGTAHHGAIIKNIINGNISIAGAICSLENLHLEGGASISIDGAEVVINSAYLWKKDNTPINILNRSKVDLENITIIYPSERADYQNDNCIDINVANTGTTLNVKNCFKCIKTDSDTSYKNFMGLNTNLDYFNENSNLHSITSSTYNGRTVTPYIPTRRTGSYSILGNAYEKSGMSWKEASATYYYSAIMIYDKVRMVGNSSSHNEKTFNATYNGPGLALQCQGLSNSNYRFYRGLSTGNYNKYVDVGLINNIFNDIGYIGGCNKWLDREPGDIDTVLNATDYQLINNNVIVHAADVPTVGTWTRGDIIINNAPSTNGVYGWICTVSGTPGTWRKISTITE